MTLTEKLLLPAEAKKMMLDLVNDQIDRMGTSSLGIDKNSSWNEIVTLHTKAIADELKTSVEQQRHLGAGQIRQWKNEGDGGLKKAGDHYHQLREAAGQIMAGKLYQKPPEPGLDNMKDVEATLKNLLLQEADERWCNEVLEPQINELERLFPELLFGGHYLPYAADTLLSASGKADLQRITLEVLTGGTVKEMKVDHWMYNRFLDSDTFLAESNGLYDHFTTWVQRFLISPVSDELKYSLFHKLIVQFDLLKKQFVHACDSGVQGISGAMMLRMDVIEKLRSMTITVSRDQMSLEMEGWLVTCMNNQHMIANNASDYLTELSESLPKPANVPTDFKRLSVSVSLPVLAGLVRILMFLGIIVETNVMEVYRWMAAVFSTEGAPEPSAEAIKREFNKNILKSYSFWTEPKHSVFNEALKQTNMQKGKKKS